MTISHSLGFPRIGPRRELKRALESYWAGKLDKAQFEAATNAVRADGWRAQSEAGLDFIPVGDFALYDHVLDVSMMIGNIPDRFNTTDSYIDKLFLMGRGRSIEGEPTAAGEMTKWFNTNYHYIVPELNSKRALAADAAPLIRQIDAARKAGYNPKPVIVGPFTYLLLSKLETGGAGARPLDFAPALARVYKDLLAQIDASGVEWIQIDEPALTLDLDADWLDALTQIYAIIGAGNAKRLLTTYFESATHNLDAILKLPIDGLHIDIATAPQQLDAFVAAAKDSDLTLSLGVINGRSVWKTNLEQVLETLAPVQRELGDRLWIAPSCSLMFSPFDLDSETKLDPEIKSWLAFAVQKLDELALLKRALSGGDKGAAADIGAYSAAVKARRDSKRIHNPAVKARVAGVDDAMRRRGSPYAERIAKQIERLRLPLLPTTTVGSFPQTPEIRKARADYRNGRSAKQAYETAMRASIKDAIGRQESYSLDVLVHGEPERNDMVEYFGEQLDGYISTQAGWVQSYGSRCVKPPIIYGDIARPNAMTVDWITYAQSLTAKPVKGMLTGPVTMLAWAFRRDDVSFEESCAQIALALRDEIVELERAGVRIIQLDEPAFREAAPLRAAERRAYYETAVNCFKLATCGVRDETQIQSHMCYSDFNRTSIEHVAAMDVDVLLIEASRSGKKILATFKDFHYPNCIGIGAFDIHSPNIPTIDAISQLLADATALIDKRQIWVTPDCGLKTRTWEQAEKALQNMAAAAARARQEKAATGA